MLTSRACFELGFSDHAVIAEALRAHGMNPSLVAVTFRVSRRGSIAIPAVDRLRRSCPRWWKAMGLAPTAKEALEATIVRGAASGAAVGGNKDVIKAYDVSHLSRSRSRITRRVSTRLSSTRTSPRRSSPRMQRYVSAPHHSLMVQLAGSHDGFETYLRRDVFGSGKTQEELVRVAQTKTAILRRVSIPF